MTLAPGADGRARCWWAVGTPEYEAYHDREWGRAEHDDRRLFEKLSLEAFQSGLSWLTILRKRDAFREAFAGFDIAEVARFDARDVERLAADRRIVRNRAKIRAVLENARAAEAIIAAEGSFDRFVWRFAPDTPPPAPRDRSDVPATTPGSAAMANALKARGFRFVGATTCYAFMQAMGMVNDHVAGCWARDGLALN